MHSIWQAPMPAFPPQSQDINTQVLIIGGGLAGVLCAWRLHQAGVDYTLIEENTIGSQTTGGTTAKITAQHGLIYDKWIRRFGIAKARLYLEANQRALAQYRALAQTIDCDFERQNAYVYAKTDRQCLQREVNALRCLGFHAELVQPQGLPFPTVGAVCFSHQAQINPRKLLAGLAGGLHIYEHTKAQKLTGTQCITNRGRIRAQKVIVATHFPLLNKRGGFCLKLYQQRSYVLALKNVDGPEGMYIDAEPGGLSLRRYQDYCLLGGAGLHDGSHDCGRHAFGYGTGKAQSLRVSAESFAQHAKGAAMDQCRRGRQKSANAHPAP